MHEWVDPRERTFGAITLVLGCLVWLGLIVGTFGGALIGLLIGFLFYLFAQSALIARIKGQGVAVSAEQLPELHAHFVACCERLSVIPKPEIYVLNGQGVLNAFATRFLGHQYVVLFSDVVDAMARHEEGIRFYIGHELGHLRLKHLQGHLLRWPVLWLPLLGAAYSRARERSCDRHGLACCSTPDIAARALAALATGSRQWQAVSLDALRAQAGRSGGFWMSFHELLSAYPWLTKRIARVLDVKGPVPRRHPLAWLLAMWVPFAGRLGAGAGFLVMVYLVGVLAAIAIPAYQEYQARARHATAPGAMTLPDLPPPPKSMGQPAAPASPEQPGRAASMDLKQAALVSQEVRDRLAAYYERQHRVPTDLAEIGIPRVEGQAPEYFLERSNMVLRVRSGAGMLEYTPRLDAKGKVSWVCRGSAGTPARDLPDACTWVPNR